MAIHPPIITNYPENVVTVISTDSTSYESIVESTGSIVYGVSKIYLKSTQESQLLQPFSFTQYDVNGVIEQYSQVVTIDPYQYQNSSTFDLSKKNVTLNGRNNVGLSVLPNERVNLIFYTKEAGNRNILPPTNFFENDFFEDYAKEI